MTIPQLHPPGEEAEVDFGGVSVWLDGVLTGLSLFVMRLVEAAAVVGGHAVRGAQRPPPPQHGGRAHHAARWLRHEPTAPQAGVRRSAAG